MTTPHVDVGAYLLGALDDAEMSRFEEHLAGCESCGRQLDELSGLLPVLEELRGDSAEYVPPPGDALLERLLGQVAGERRSRKRRRLVAVAAAAVLVIGGPSIAVLASQDNGGTPTAAPSFAADRVTAANPATGAAAVVGMTDKGWGTAVDLRMTGIRGPLTCSLIAVGADGGRETVASWSVPSDGYGTDVHPKPLTVHGATGLHKGAISRFDVRATDGTLLVSVPT